MMTQEQYEAVLARADRLIVECERLRIRQASNDWVWSRIAALEAALAEQLYQCAACRGKGSLEGEPGEIGRMPCPACAAARALLTPPVADGG